MQRATLEVGLCKSLGKIRNTPLIELKYRKNLYAKNETVNPTGTHKDRGVETAIADMINKGQTTISCASSGNHAKSVEYYAKQFGFKAITYTEGDYLTNWRRINKLCQEHNYYNANAGKCVALLEGLSLIGEEIAKIKPEYVICPVNNGTLYVGIYEGLLRKHCSPIMIGATAKNSKIAKSLRGLYRLEPKLIDVIEDSKGSLMDIPDRSIEYGIEVLAKEGLNVCPASATVIGALDRLRPDEDKKVVLIITGKGK